MRRLIARYKTLTRAERSLLLRAWVILAALRVGIRVIPFGVLQRWIEHLRATAGAKVDPDQPTVSTVVWAIAAASRRIPGTTCLPRAMAAHLLLGRCLQPSVLRLGVALKPDGALEAHAWVDVAGQVVIGRIDDFDRFIPLQSQAA